MCASKYVDLSWYLYWKMLSKNRSFSLTISKKNKNHKLTSVTYLYWCDLQPNSYCFRESSEKVCKIMEFRQIFSKIQCTNV